MEVYSNDSYQVLADRENNQYILVNITTGIQECESRYLPEAVDIANNLDKECKRVFEVKPSLI